MDSRLVLHNRQKIINSLLCVGLDPILEQVPTRFRERYMLDSVAVFAWLKWVVDQTAPFASMYKLQRAHYETIEGGEAMMRFLIAYIHESYPGIPVFVDCKRGDIDRTQTQYGKAHLLLDGADGMNYNSYMGKDTLRSLINDRSLGKALVGLGRTSNPDAWEMQDVLMQDGRAYWEHVVEKILLWSHEFGVSQNAGVVMGAAYIDNGTTTYSDHLRRCRKIVGDTLWLLIPGVGAQGGLVKETVEAAFMGAGSMVISSSSGIINAADPAGAAETLRDQIRQAGGIC